MEKFLNAIEEYFDAKTDYKEKAKNCEYNRDYFLYEEKTRLENSKTQIKIALNEIIRNEIKNANPKI